MADKTSKAMSLGFGSPGCGLMPTEAQTGENRIDRLSDLPDAVIYHIFSFIPYKEAVRTSVLSTRWKHLLASAPYIDIGHHFFFLHDTYDPATFPRFTNFMDFLDRVLLSSSSYVSRFCLGLWGGIVDTAHVCRWVSALSRRGISELDLSIRTHHFPASIFTCKTLKVLKLNLDKFVMNVPADVCFPNLKILHLCSVIFPDDVSAQTLFSACLVLEDLVIRKCDLTNVSKFNIFIHTLKRLTILAHIVNLQVYDNNSQSSHRHDHNLVLDTPMLVYFKYDDELARGFSFINMGSLEEAYIYATTQGERAAYHASLLDLMQGISNVKTLNLAYFSSLVLGYQERSMLTFYNLINLTIDTSRCGCDGLAKLLLSSPQLETVTITLSDDCTGLEDEEMPFCTFSCLKTISIKYFNFTDGQMQMVKCFMENAQVLRNLNLRLSCALSKEVELRMTTKLMEFPMRSSKCQLNVARGTEVSGFFGLIGASFFYF